MNPRHCSVVVGPKYFCQHRTSVHEHGLESKCTGKVSVDAKLSAVQIERVVCLNNVVVVSWSCMFSRVEL